MLKILLLGRVSVTLHDKPVAGFVSRKALALLAYLATEMDRPHSREALAGLFWPEQSEVRARKNLRDVLSNLQKVLGNRKAKPPYLKITRTTVQFNPQSLHEVDVHSFQQSFLAWKSHRHRNPQTCRICADNVEQVVGIYRGDFLLDLFVKDSSAFEDWQMLMRERLHRNLLEALDYLTHFYAQRGQYTQALQFASRRVDSTPWVEDAQRQRMRLLALDGQRSAALAQFKICRQILEKEFGVAPTEETLTLYEQIKSGKIGERHQGVRHNLPTSLTPLIGRKAELVEIANYLVDPRYRMLTLVGPGGVGKTRLALQAAWEEIYTFPHGVFFVPLVAIETSEQLVFAMATAFNLTFYGRSDPKSQLINYLRKKEILLVMDNFEHLLDEGTSLLVEILQKSPGTVFMITSREPLHLRVEQLITVKGLPFPAPDSKFEESQALDSVRLFVESARRIKSNLSATQENIVAIGRICRMVRGLPLAIELVATWIRHSSCEKIAQQIENDLHRLETSMIDIPARHRSLRAVCEHSWRLLSAQEQDAFAKLSVFRGGFDTTSALQVVGATADILSSLVGKSLLSKSSSGRYEMHEWIRQFAWKKLANDPQVQMDIRNQHCTWACDLLKAQEPAILGGGQMAALSKIESEIENLRAGWHWAIVHRKLTEIDKAKISLTYFFDLKGWFSEGEATIQQALAVCDQHNDDLRGWLLALKGHFDFRLGDYQEAERVFQESLFIGRHVENPEIIAFALQGLAGVYMNLGKYHETQAFATESLKIARQANIEHGQTKSLDILGIIARYQGDFEQAKIYLQQSRLLYQENGDQFGLARNLNLLGNLAAAQGNYQEANDLLFESLRVSREIDYLMLRAYALNNLGNLAGQQQNYRTAIKYFRDGLALFEEMGDQSGIALGQVNMGTAYARLGQNSQAREHLKKGINLAMEIGATPILLGCLLGIANIEDKENHVANALVLAAFVSQHPTSRNATKTEAQELQDKLVKKLPKEVAAAAIDRGKNSALDEIVKHVLNDVGNGS